ncbi:uncharacterized protein EURHEDRAFT_413756 [Aspergillus ruber CBS 135680]|uniref:Uncharacterized protein n=1 Tax=Aspergillus ruber (strain CBS 135680) TaxID=1388766 RepID=A0A017SAV3_ASPRC|nr:uncharacterized protein EURHEDRAFT_413756 [Aspergillus ruber CBS 135680]EYE93769.1 hypothetical protein EURHEDRAFT_413756 [Aspergillus ruber CBS 135680]
MAPGCYICQYAAKYDMYIYCPGVTGDTIDTQLFDQGHVHWLCGYCYESYENKTSCPYCRTHRNTVDYFYWSGDGATRNEELSTVSTSD